MQRVASTPLHLAKLVMLGSTIAALAYAALFLPFPRPIVGYGLAVLLWSERLKLACVVLPLLLGFGLAYWNNHRLTSGINHLRFSDDELEAVRQLLNQPWLKTTQIALYGAIVVLAVFQLTSHSHTNNLGFLLLFAVNPLTYLRANLARKPSTPKPIDWATSQPIRSAHWGETGGHLHDDTSQQS